jgi:PHD/YefM family antitoxin component YafN of YafNO toxin-antitoxin module
LTKPGFFIIFNLRKILWSREMPIHYLTDAQGKKVAVVVPLEEWEGLQAKLRDLAYIEPVGRESEAHPAFSIMPSIDFERLSFSAQANKLRHK